MKNKSIRLRQYQVDNLLNNKEAIIIYSQQAEVVEAGLLIKDKK